MAWLSLQALRIWVDHGPVRTLVGPAAHIPFAPPRCVTTTPSRIGR